MAVLGLLLFVRLQPDGAYLTDFLPGVMLASIGMGLTFVPVTLIATSGIPPTMPASYNTSQQVGGALGLAILAAGIGRAPGPADQAQALVDGFHVAYVGSAALVAVAAVLLAVLLRREDVVAVDEGEAVPEPVAA